MATRRSALLFLVAASLLCVFFSFVQSAHAQFNFLTALPNESQDLTITLSPQYPGPDQTVQLSVQSSYFDLTQASVTWYANGNVIAEGEGITNASMTTGAIGTQTNIEVDAQTADGTTASAEVAIIPTEIDILFDSDSYTPPFYEGRALPSAGTTVRLQAIPHFDAPDGAALPASTLTYTWKENGRIIASASGKGKSMAILPAPTLDESTTITVDAVSSDLTLSGESSVTIPVVKPILELYEDDPLFGTLYNNALGSQTSIEQTEMTFQAVPYFAQIQNPNDPRLRFSWTVNGSSVSPNKADPSEITINAQNSSGAAQIALGITEPINIFMDSQGQWSVLLNSDASSAGVFQSSESTQPTSPFGQ